MTTPNNNPTKARPIIQGSVNQAQTRHHPSIFMAQDAYWYLVIPIPMSIWSSIFKTDLRTVCFVFGLVSNDLKLVFFWPDFIRTDHFRFNLFWIGPTQFVMFFDRSQNGLFYFLGIFCFGFEFFR